MTSAMGAARTRHRLHRSRTLLARPETTGRADDVCPPESPWALIVDEDPGSRAILIHAATSLAYRIVETSSAAAARTLLRSGVETPDLVIVDADTRHALGLVGLISADAEVPVVVSAWRGSQVVRGLGSACDGFVAKPLQLPRAVTEIRAAARRTPAQRMAIRAARTALSESA